VADLGWLNPRLLGYRAGLYGVREMSEKMQTLEDKKREMTTLIAKKDEISARIRVLEHQIAADESEFRAGDTISYRFGSTRRKGVVQSVLPGGHLIITGLRKDGSAGALCQVYCWDKIAIESKATGAAS
jgi:hypothetical protein